MKLRIKLILMIVFLSLYYFLFSLVLLLGEYFDEEYRVESEKLSQGIYNETSLSKIRFARYYYGRSNRPNINSLYAISNIIYYIEDYQESDDDQSLLKIDWHFSNVTSLQILERNYPAQYELLKYYSPLSKLILIYVQNNAFDHFHFLCQNGLGISFQGEDANSSNNWYDTSISNCKAYDDCYDYITQYSTQIAFPKLDLKNDVWRMRAGKEGYECKLHAQKKRELAIINSSRPVINSFLTNGNINIISDGQLLNSTLEDALQIWPNQTSDFTDQLYTLVTVPIEFRQWRMLYDGMGEQRVVFFSTYYFAHPNYPNITLTKEIITKCSMIYLQSMSLQYYLQLAGQNDQATTVLINEIIIACALHVVLIFYFWRKGVVIALSLEVPINQLIKLTKVDMKYLEVQDFNLESYKDLFNNKEIRKFYEVIINYLNSIKYSNNKLLQGSKDMDEAEALIILSMSKRFYKKYYNNPAVGICANNIAKIHMRNQRYLEAMNEQEESVLIANQDLQSLKEMEQYANQAAQPQDDQQLIKLYLRLKNNVLQKFQRQEEKVMKEVIKDLESKTKNGIVRRPTTQKFKTQNETTQLKSSIESEAHLQRQQTPRQTSNWLRKPIQEEKNAIREENSDLPSERLDNLGTPKKLSPISKINSNEEYSKKQVIIEHKIVFRKYQLACILYNYSMTKSQSTFLNESVKQFNDIMDDLQNLPDSFSIQYMKINIITKKAFCFARAGMLEKARLELEDAEARLKILQANKTEIQQLEISDFVDIFREIPLEILREKLTGLEASLLMIRGEYVEACYKFISILKAEGHYDPGFQKFVLKTLTKIFKRCNVDHNCLIKFSQQNQLKRLELIFLLDYSSEMTNEQFTLSHHMCQNVVQSLNDDSFVGLYAFNESLHEIFPLQLKGTYKKLLESTIEKVLIKPGGEGNIFSALEITIASLFEKDKPEQSKQLSLHLKSNQIKQQIEQEEFRCSDMEFRCKTSSPRVGKTFSGGFSQAMKQYEEQQFDNVSLNENMVRIEDNLQQNQYKIDIDNIDEEKDEHTIRYVCIFSEGVHNYNQMSIDRLKSLIEKKNIHLLVFNIANQNMNMLYLKQLAQVSSESRFFTNENEIKDFFSKLRTNDFTKRVYLEFF
ncbi:unnamed protein product (macronuclear) [Paramecium tetraurelia]|uniref:VWFA domain-containing protein n=1 Tax=Paramecium tetraurelia TaxID=5888 RepID=A0BLY8_PARTE|nr:uncharacterized protein GSPATT00030189001 [Paramecium tetraurelia]CAK59555.1 unnamed protein product [Paramecium tetraurelia]|eukprot:XP_001426953.1 hypothetical protein (macronuclear) [Paramecium tetraurelia strain d4-2]